MGVAGAARGAALLLHRLVARRQPALRGGGDEGGRGAGSTHLHALPLGATLEAKGPQGTFTRPLANAPPSLFVGTGTGLAPLRSMVKDALAHGSAAPMVVLVGVRSLADALYVEELRALARAHPCLSVELTLSRPADGWTGRRGYVQEHVGALWDALAAQGTPHAWLCGLKKMAVATRDLLKARGVERQRLHVEAFD